jgi:hypothetical protein
MELLQRSKLQLVVWAVVVALQRLRKGAFLSRGVQLVVRPAVLVVQLVVRPAVLVVQLVVRPKMAPLVLYICPHASLCMHDSAAAAPIVSLRLEEAYTCWAPT